jgi:hypothetical protein
LYRAIVGEGIAGQLSVGEAVEVMGVRSDLRATVYTMVHFDPLSVHSNLWGEQEGALNRRGVRAS